MFRLLVAATLFGAVAAQPNAQCNIESQALVAAGIAVSDPSCTALAAYEGCVARVEDRSTQRALEIALAAYQEMMQGCTAAPMTAALRTKRDEVHVSGGEIFFHRTVRQTVNVHELASQVEANELALSTIRGETASTLAASMSTMNSQMLASASTAASTAAASASTLEASTSNALSTSISSMLSSAASTTTFVAAELDAATRARASLNVSVQQAIAAAANAAQPTVYIQWGTKLCTSPAANVAVVRLYDGIAYGSRHNDQGGGSTNMCLKNAAGDQGGQRQGGQDSNDMVVPLRRDHAGYSNLPSRNNLMRSRDGYVIPCAKCQYAKSCFMETGVAVCPNGYHKMYTGYMFGGHSTHRGNNDRFCIDKNPQNNDYTARNNWYGYVYPTLARDGTGSGLLRNNRVALACHQCCVR
jgi:hypothetical protein